MGTTLRTSDRDVEAVRRAESSVRSGRFGLAHIESEYLLDIPTVIGTLISEGPWTWAQPRPGTESPEYVLAATLSEIEAAYEDQRTRVELLKFTSMTQKRTEWYAMTHGSAELTAVGTGDAISHEAVVLFPIGDDGIRGEMQVGHFGHQAAALRPTGTRARLEVCELHDRYVDVLRTQDFEKLRDLCRDDIGLAIRDYTRDDGSMIQISGVDALIEHYNAIVEQYTISDIQVVERIIESWYVFAELLWTVSPINGPNAGEIVQFCTADLAPIDLDCKFWIRTGYGTNPVHPRTVESSL
jgi:hypothetical protein